MMDPPSFRGGSGRSLLVGFVFGSSLGLPGGARASFLSGTSIHTNDHGCSQSPPTRSGAPSVAVLMAVAQDDEDEAEDDEEVGENEGEDEGEEEEVRRALT